MTWAIANTNQTGVQGASGATSISVSFPNAVTAGNLIAVTVSEWDPISGTTPTQLTSVSDNKNSTTYTNAAALNAGGFNSYQCEIDYFVAVSGGSAFTVTGTSAGGLTVLSMAITEFSFTSGATISVDGHTTNHGNSSAPSTTTSTLTSGDLLYCGLTIGYNGATITAGSGFTLGSYQSNFIATGTILGVATEYILNAATWPTTTFTATTNIDFVFCAASFKATGGGATASLFRPANLRLGAGGPFFQSGVNC